jgi:hypothetical protein
MAPKRLANILLIQPLKSLLFFNQPQISIKKYIPTPGQKLYKRIPCSCHIFPLPLLWHEFKNCLCNFLQSKVSCCLHMYFLWRHHLPPDKSENDQDSDSDWFTYCIDIWLLTLLTFSLQYLSESCFGNDDKFLLPNPRVVLFFIYPISYTHSKFCLPNPFLFGATAP